VSIAENRSPEAGTDLSHRFLAILNPAAGGGRSSKLAAPALARLREGGLTIDVIATKSAGHATEVAREGYRQGYRRFIAIGGDGTAHEILNGIYSGASTPPRISLGFLPMGTGNSFLRDFSTDGAESSIRALLAGRSRSADLLRLKHAGGEIYSFNLISVGFTADVGALTNRYFKSLGHLGYLLGVLVRVIQLHRRGFPLRCDDDTDTDARPCLFLTFSNSKFTGGTMMIAPNADASDGMIEFVRWGPIGRLGLIRMLPKLYDGSHIEHPLAARRPVRRIEFDLPEPVDVMIDGEIANLTCRSIDILPGAVDVYV
jgi:diacylglycerol kinase (ATP)